MTTPVDPLVNKIKAFKKSFNDAIKRIEAYTNDEDENMRKLARWLVATHENPYTIFHHEAWAASMNNSAEDFCGLLSHIHHALVDDGDICFPVINGQPTIVFESRWDLQENIDKLKKPHNTGFTFEVSFLGNVDAFIEHRNQYNKSEARRGFVSDAARHGVEYIKERMQKNPASAEHITDDWVYTEGLKAVDEYKSKYWMLFEDRAGPA